MSKARDEELALWAGGALLLGLAVWKAPVLIAGVEVMAGTVNDLFERGARLNNTSTNEDGIVPDEPEALLQEASRVVGYQIDRDAYALARMGRSEGTDGRAARMHVALNDLAALQQQYGTNIYSSVWALMLRSKKRPDANGRFSQQYLGKRYATDEDPYVGDLKLAELVIGEHARGVDPTGGATKFVDINSFGAQRGTGTYEQVLAEWTADGYTPASVPGTSSNFVVFRRA